MQITKHLLALKKPFYFRLLISWMFLVLLLSLFSFPSNNLDQIPNSDKWIHLVMYGIMSVLSFLFFNAPPKTKNLKLWQPFLLPFFYGMIIEILQELPLVNRQSDVMDVVANSVGIILGLILSVITLKKELQKKTK